MITQKRVKELFDYKDGKLYRRIGKGTAKKGDRAGYKHLSRGIYYQAIKIDQVRYFEHKLIWLYLKSYMPERLDHKDRNGLNNSIENLREATASQNAANSIKRKNNTSGWKGVSWDKDRKKWRAIIGINGGQKHLGLFQDPKEAAKAYNQAALNHFGRFARTNEIFMSGNTNL